jgi:outer membrane protein assembly factor BamE (lipoprotein component of BamABCDE complex)
VNAAAMRFLLPAMIVAALLAATGGFSLAVAQDARAVAGASRAATERAAVDLKQGMTLEEVRELLGKPWRTAMTQGTLRWTYTWTASASDRNLNIDFTAKAPEQWTVGSWSWSSY